MRSTRWLARMLRAFAFGWIVLLGAAVFYTPQLNEALGPSSWLASLLPAGPVGMVVWLGVATLNAGAAFYLAEVIES